ncbi:hypothetical protein TURU_160320 [Turdus rufiventris]|nr:hypothetical protein TURU_160320 [Turdus rufiventris]
MFIFLLVRKSEHLLIQLKAIASFSVTWEKRPRPTSVQLPFRPANDSLHGAEMESGEAERTVKKVAMKEIFGVFKKNNIDGCERAAGPSYEMEINHLHQSEEAIVSFGLRQYKQRQISYPDIPCFDHSAHYAEVLGIGALVKGGREGLWVKCRELFLQQKGCMELHKMGSYLQVIR